jgi:hypothetical protein
MRRSVALIAAAISTFTLVVLASVVYAYQGFAAPLASSPQGGNQQPVAVQVDGANPGELGVNPQAGVQSQSLSPQAAAALAAKLLNRTDLYSAQAVTYSGVQAYKVTFSSGYTVYVSLQGQVLGVVPPAPVITSAGPGTRGGGGHNHSAGGGEHSGGSETEGGEGGG